MGMLESTSGDPQDRIKEGTDRGTSFARETRSQGKKRKGRRGGRKHVQVYRGPSGGANGRKAGELFR
ncbi:hypothetical protein MRX96_054251 [Rhipicephalus microplus]